MAVTAEEWRNEGNTFYKGRKLTQAISCYDRASELDSKSPLPLSNLSAAYFETGDYTACIEAAEKALQLCADKDVVLQEKLRLRLQQASSYSKSLEGRSPLASLPGNSRNGNLDSQKADMPLADDDLDTNSSDLLQARIIDQMNVTKTPLKTIGENFPFGHDHATSLYDEKLYKAVSNDASVSLFFGGIGDARNLYATFAWIAGQELDNPTKISYSITINDIKPAAIARDLVILFYLEALVELPNREAEAFITFNSLFYIFSAPILPPLVYQHLRKAIVITLRSIEQEAMPSWIKFREDSISQVVDILREWHHEGEKAFSTKTIIQEIRRNAGKNLQRADKELPKALKIESQCFAETAVLFPHEKLGEALDPELHKMVKEYKKKPNPNILEKIRDEAAERWMPNLSMMDLTWLKEGDHLYNLNPDPWELWLKLLTQSAIGHPRSVEGFFDVVTHFFQTTVSGLARITDRLTIEVAVGNISQVLEGSRVKGQKYDRIHMSNIPDYIGGSLFNFVYALPVLKDHKSSFFTSCCLRNPMEWKSIASFNNEYLVMHENSQLSKVFRAKYHGNFEDPEGSQADMPNPLPVMDYHMWSRLSPDKLVFEKLLPRADLEKWLFGLFFKLYVPNPRLPGYMWSIIYAANNITIFFRLLRRLHEVGYPAHWLSQLLLRILANDVTTTARPPKSCPLSFQETKFSSPAKHFDLQPFLPEMSTLASIWQPILPFGIPSPLPSPNENNSKNNSNSTIPPLTSISQYHIRFTNLIHQIDKQDCTCPEFVILLIHPHLLEDLTTEAEWESESESDFDSFSPSSSHSQFHHSTTKRKPYKNNKSDKSTEKIGTNPASHWSQSPWGLPDKLRIRKLLCQEQEPEGNGTTTTTSLSQRENPMSQFAIITNMSWDMNSEIASFWIRDDFAERIGGGGGSSSTDKGEVPWMGLLFRTDRWTTVTEPVRLRLASGSSESSGPSGPAEDGDRDGKGGEDVQGKGSGDFWKGEKWFTTPPPLSSSLRAAAFSPSA